MPPPTRPPARTAARPPARGSSSSAVHSSSTPLQPVDVLQTLAFRLSAVAATSVGRSEKESEITDHRKSQAAGNPTDSRVRCQGVSESTGHTLSTGTTRTPNKEHPPTTDAPTTAIVTHNPPFSFLGACQCRQHGPRTSCQVDDMVLPLCHPRPLAPAYAPLVCR